MQDVIQNNTESGRKMDEPFERLKKARLAAGYKSAAEAARALGMKLETYHKHENGMNGLGRNAIKYARFFKVSLDWLLRGEGMPDLSEKTPATAAWLDVEKLRSALAVLLHIMAGLSEDEADRLGQELIQLVRMPPDYHNKLSELEQTRFRVETLGRLAAGRAKTEKPRTRKH